MSWARPLTGQPWAAKASSGPLASWSTLAPVGSASQPASACSSDSVSWVGSTWAAAPSAAASAMPVSTPVPRPHWPLTAMPTRASPEGVLVEPRHELVSAEPAADDVEALVGLGLDRLQRRVQPLAQHPELQRVEELVHLVAVPLAEVQVVRPDVERHRAGELGQ